MPIKKIGRVTITASQAEVDALTPFVTEATDLLKTRIDPFELQVRERTKMPIAFVKDNGEVIYSRGNWSDRRRLMLAADDLFPAGLELLLAKTLGHEFFHVLQADWFGKWHRKQLLPVITPECEGWRDLTIAGVWRGYIADPVEALACYGSAALFGWVKPAYSTLYLRRVLQASYPTVKTLALATAP